MRSLRRLEKSGVKTESWHVLVFRSCPCEKELGKENKVCGQLGSRRPQEKDVL